ncbi:hypothetical protein PIB30_022052 [Stylosanthes scabra]|uniref:Peroxisomal and mitochondrial division factor 2 n=1 Tax=Stylosanthes scabra TaxID=79078 RepID=A0ABU6Z7L1_9FABA|nr:hypothetical protein [Stylosanthes scabra]
MAEDSFTNGVDERSRIEALERERDDLASESEERKEQIKKLTMEIEGLRSDGDEMKEKILAMEKELEQSRDATKAASAIAARAADLETELARLQHDSISDMSAAEESRAEAFELRKLLSEKESKVESLERELESLKKEKSEAELKIRDLEKKIGALENNDVDERSKWTRVEEELREKIQEKEKEVLELGQKIKEAVNSKKSEMEEWVKEKLSLQEALKGSEERAKSLESIVARLREEAGETEDLIRGLNQRVVEAVNGGVNGNGVVAREGKVVKGLNVQWPVVAAGSTVVAAAAVICVFYGKRR